MGSRVDAEKDNLRETVCLDSSQYVAIRCSFKLSTRSIWNEEVKDIPRCLA